MYGFHHGSGISSECMYCMYIGGPSVTVSMEMDSINWDQGRGLLNESYLFKLREQTWFATHHWLPCSHLCSRALRLSWETMKCCSRTIPGPFAQLILPGGTQEFWTLILILILAIIFWPFKCQKWSNLATFMYRKCPWDTQLCKIWYIFVNFLIF